MLDPNAVYAILKFWLPLLSGIGLSVKIGKWLKDKINELLNNHLKHIQTAVELNAKEALKTNELLISHHEKQMAVWNTVASTLAVLEDRTRGSRSKTRKKAHGI